MAKTRFGVVYGVQSGCRLRAIYPDDDGELADPARLAPGEAIVTLPLQQAGDVAAVLAAVALASGIATPPATRAAVLDALGSVIDVIEADPVLGKHPAGNALFWHPSANLGDRVIGNVLVPAPPPVLTAAQRLALAALDGAR